MQYALAARKILPASSQMPARETRCACVAVCPESGVCARCKDSLALETCVVNPF
jgi:hypothetical protein